MNEAPFLETRSALMARAQVFSASEPSFARFLEAIGTPCAVSSDGAGLSDQELAALKGTGPLAATAMIAPPDTVATPFVPWLLALALVLALAEIFVRRSQTR